MLVKLPAAHASSVNARPRAVPRLGAQAVTRPSKHLAPLRASPFDDRFPVSPFQLMDEQMRFMDRQMAAFDRQFDAMQHRMDAEFDSAVMDARVAEQQARAAVERARSMQVQPGSPDVRIQRQEQRGPGTYRYYESIEIRSGGGGYNAMLAPGVAVGPPAPLLLLAALLAGAYVAVSAAFWRNFGATTFADKHRWKLVPLWPLLALFNERFRQQFVEAVWGKRNVQGQGQQGDSNSNANDPSGGASAAAK